MINLGRSPQKKKKGQHRAGKLGRFRLLRGAKCAAEQVMTFFFFFFGEHHSLSKFFVK